MKYRVWLTVQAVDPSTMPMTKVGDRTTFVLYEGPDRRHSVRLERNLRSAVPTNRVPHVIIAESGWEVID